VGGAHKPDQWQRLLDELEISTPDAESVDPEDPEHYGQAMLCPITQAVMQNPVSTPSGYTYERSAILRHLANNGSPAPDPMTKELFTEADLRPNRALKDEIETRRLELQEKQKCCPAVVCAAESPCNLLITTPPTTTTPTPTPLAIEHADAQQEVTAVKKTDSKRALEVYSQLWGNHITRAPWETDLPTDITQIYKYIGNNDRQSKAAHGQSMDSAMAVSLVNPADLDNIQIDMHDSWIWQANVDAPNAGTRFC